VIDALRAELDWPEHPTVLVVEDVHWADEATLDVLRFLVRRISSLPVVLVLTYRDDEVTRDHPLQRLLGLASGTPRLRRLRLARLSPAAVRRMGAGSGLDTDQVFEVTSGNPFFVAEVLASGDLGGVPATIADAVRARLADLDGPTLDALEQLAVVPSTVERWLVEAVVPGGLAALSAAERGGVLTVHPDRVAFRHELVRRAVLDSMPAVRRVACNQAVLAALLDRPGGVDLSRILHHAAEVGDRLVITRTGPAAAREAAAAGSHRESVAHYRRVLEHRDAYPPAARADLLEGYAVECYTIGLAESAVAAQEEAVGLRRGFDGVLALGEALRWLSRMRWWSGDRPAAEASAAEAIEVMESAGEVRGLALALSNQSQLHVLAGRATDGVAVGQRAVDMARGIGDAATLSHALDNVGMGYWHLGDPRGLEMMRESLAVALAAGEVEHAGRAYVSIAWSLIDDLELDEADRVLEEAVEVAEEAELLGFLRYMRVMRGRLRLARGSWDEAEREASWGADAQPIIRCPALVVLGRIRSRRGLDGGEDMLTEAWGIARRVGEPQRLGPAGSALLEAAWLRGDFSPTRSLSERRQSAFSVAVAAVLPLWDHVRRFGATADVAELGYWLRLAGAPVTTDPLPHPYALLAAGKWREAAQVWQRAGCRYEYATALADSPEPADVLEALSTLDALGAEPLARRVRQRLRELGVVRIPRGPAPSTRDNPAGLTERQVEVVRLLAGGLSNAEIAARLVLSVRTVDSHVAAVLDKLDARTRRDAADLARAMGIVA
jgi:DNA-binding CsgD family transcriptional regulator